MQIDKSKLDELRGLLATPQRIVILAHTNPDGDAVGSSLAWAEILRQEGHKVECVVPNRFPYYLDFMPASEQMIIYKSDS
ncbi:MAG: bifunctional oligoribonuclease/PAP phosphatase NrnA, partial [Alistipes sp.]|nr:bifunctional oligoribonuclease/PAP phosphatase NrnA [Alistipes sp.]